ncbi:SRPBCC family protein [Paracoccus laeviglucosivorans]|uniref:Uncharacterized conserved protein YndB, AHSA1/START domain n=1 Tax=Paracoccus laeviglucosivorans TaxID=1197861 RepID=A0A521F0B7_9RHOB|nr:SRPBCC family protein [Paracoccus laeviglucosivorans]SMO89567.1 Uncharacterized conserved protein YndB, AHSA1/START domain [Paracoccus laeviglucosivorans]
MNTQEQVDDYGQMTDGATLVIRRWLPGPASRVWRYLTQSDLRRQWLASGEMRLEPDAPLELVWRNDDLCHAPDRRADTTPEESRLQSRVISFQPERELKIAWNNGDVTFALEEHGDRVLLTVTHTGLDDRDTRTKVAAGWHTHLDILVAKVKGTKGPSFWVTWNRLQAEYSQSLPR